MTPEDKIRKVLEILSLDDSLNPVIYKVTTNLLTEVLEDM